MKDYMGRRDVSRDVRIESGEESFENVLEHVYEGLTEPTTFVVRVQVIVDGLRGQCARNREVDVRPPPSGVQTSGVQTSGVQTAFVGPVDNTIGDSRISSSVSFGLKFTVFRTMTLRSVRVYPEGPEPWSFRYQIPMAIRSGRVQPRSRPPATSAYRLG